MPGSWSLLLGSPPISSRSWAGRRVRIHCNKYSCTSHNSKKPLRMRKSRVGFAASKGPGRLHCVPNVTKTTLPSIGLCLGRTSTLDASFLARSTLRPVFRHPTLRPSEPAEVPDAQTPYTDEPSVGRVVLRLSGRTCPRPSDASNYKEEASRIPQATSGKERPRSRLLLQSKRNPLHSLLPPSQSSR